jgi:hypothetical protein
LRELCNAHAGRRGLFTRAERCTGQKARNRWVKRRVNREKARLEAHRCKAEAGNGAGCVVHVLLGRVDMGSSQK